MKKIIFFVLFLILILIGVYAYFYWRAVQIKPPVSSHTLVIPPKPASKASIVPSVPSEPVRAPRAPEPVLREESWKNPLVPTAEPVRAVPKSLPAENKPSDVMPEKLPEVPVSSIIQRSTSLSEELIARGDDIEEPVPSFSNVE